MRGLKVAFYSLMCAFIIQGEVSSEEYASGQRMGDWVVSSSEGGRSAFTEASGRFNGKTFFSYQCMKSELGCFFRLGILESCNEGDVVALRVHASVSLYEVLSVCSYAYSRDRDKASLIIKDTGEVVGVAGLLPSMTIKGDSEIGGFEYTVSLIGAGQSIFYVNSVYLE